MNMSTKIKRLKICLACSAGGHLTEEMYLKDCYSKRQHFFITFRRQDTSDLAKTEKVYFVEDPGRNPASLVKCIVQSLRVLSKEKPDVVLSTGAGVAVSACYIAKLLLGAKVIFLESFCRVEEPSLAARLVYPIADLFMVQWPQMLGKYGPKAVYRGAIV